MNDVSDYNLWVRFKNGDNDALTLLFKKYADGLYSYGLKIIKNDSLVKDCIQDAFFQLIDKRNAIVVTSNTHIYLFKSLRNKLFEELRTEARKKNILNILSETENPAESYIEQVIIDTEEKKNIRNEINSALAKLTKKQKEIIFLKYTEGFSNAEIAELLQIDNASVRKLLYRSIKSLRNSLNKDGLILLTIFRFVNPDF